MKKYQITLSEDQMRLIANCLEDISRFASGQWKMRYTIEEIVRDLSSSPLEQMEIREDVEEKLKEIRDILYPGMPDNTGRGYNGSVFIGNTYQIYRSILHRLAIDNDWNNTYSSQALHSGNMGRIKIDKIE